MTQIKDNYMQSTEVASRDTAIILGMGRAHGKLRDRIKREDSSLEFLLAIL